MVAQAEKRKISNSTISRKINKALKKYNSSTPWPKIPLDDDLIAIADAIIQPFPKGESAVFHFILLRPVHSNRAIIMPFHAEKPCWREDMLSWKKAFDKLPKPVLNKIRVLVCDGAFSLRRIAEYHGWLVQRCHFHFMAKLKEYCSYSNFGRMQKLGKKIHKLARIVLTTENDMKLAKALLGLQLLIPKLPSKSSKSVVRSLLRNYASFRTYLTYLELNLPITTNSCESLNSKIRSLQRRAHGFRTFASLCGWIEAQFKFMASICCNGKNNIPN